LAHPGLIFQQVPASKAQALKAIGQRIIDRAGAKDRVNASETSPSTSFCREGLEGIVANRLDGRYRPGKRDWRHRSSGSSITAIEDT
jgi:hypothetical protein